MPTTLETEPVRSLLERLFREADERDPGIFAVVGQLEKGGASREDPKVAALLSEAYMPVSPASGRLLYQLIRARPARLVVEFGLSFGLSTIYLAAAVKDSGVGRVITTELDPSKIRRASENLRIAGLLDHVEIREGDARQTLAPIDEDIDVLLLDGWKYLYLPVLKLLEPKLPPSSFVVADDIDLQVEALRPYIDYIRDPANGYTTVHIPIDDGLEVSQRG
ncbi:O-methyltransferase [Aquisphaera insulae]|uniref:O-methyltransferase n=1 Tax=Aquisphaera insulae TaxID=2712864 RepID=UPI0013EC9805|nr:class I SAM-dependent methyltransferase [Aquisphaera insulae]